MRKDNRAIEKALNTKNTKRLVITILISPIKNLIKQDEEDADNAIAQKDKKNKKEKDHHHMKDRHP
ncbi:MAG: hypothetical protein JO297_21005 [Nitrososphaeraceae archaeon]|nr:hypothetical protein [Nitrososphaeraceae archaeon]